MKIKPASITVRDLCKGYSHSGIDGIRGFDGKLDIRPPYQREFIYDDVKRDAVVVSVLRGFPLNVMYWVAQSDGKFEVLDGQQRTISICSYVNKEFAVKTLDGHAMLFSSLHPKVQKQFLDYELSIYICEGDHHEKLEWFKIINIAGETLSPQEMRNAIYNGPWVADAKKYFSYKGCVAQKLGGKYVNRNVIRQEYLETAIKWITNNGDIGAYMTRHQSESNATELWEHFEKVIYWVKSTFSTYRGLMKGLDWGRLYNEHKDDLLNSEEIEKQTSRLLVDSDVTNQKGIYEYLLTEQTRHMNIRPFDANMKRSRYEYARGKCEKCKKPFPLEEMDADHIIPWSKGGHTEEKNIQILCRNCNKTKGAS